MVNRDEFWNLIEEAGANLDPSEQVEAIESELTQRTADEILDFKRHLSDLESSSYSWELWGAAYLINGGCSDDGFDYFRGWLMTRGRSVFEKALTDPDSLADLPDLEEDVECEEILYAASSAYKAVTGNEIPNVPRKLPDLGEGWDFDNDAEMRTRYPKLFAKFSE